MEFGAALLKLRQQSGMHAPVQGLHAHYLRYSTQKINLKECAFRSLIGILSKQSLVCVLLLYVTTYFLD